MSLPCICFKCARYKSLKTLNDPECLLVEEQNCKNMHCHNCTFTCERFMEIPGTHNDKDHTRPFVSSFFDL